MKNILVVMTLITLFLLQITLVQKVLTQHSENKKMLKHCISICAEFKGRQRCDTYCAKEEPRRR